MGSRARVVTVVVGVVVGAGSLFWTEGWAGGRTEMTRTVGRGAGLAAAAFAAAAAAACISSRLGLAET